MPEAQAVADFLRVVVAGVVLLWLLVATWNRIRGDGDDPSAHIGGDYLLVRVSGIIAIAVGVGAVGLLLLPEIMTTGRGLAIVGFLAALLVYWVWSESSEGFAS